MSKLDDIRALGRPEIGRAMERSKIMEKPCPKSQTQQSPLLNTIVSSEMKKPKPAPRSHNPMLVQSPIRPSSTPLPLPSEGGSPIAQPADKFVGLRLPQSLLDQIDKAAQVAGRTRSGEIRAVLEERYS